jgi:hypothetical protein
MSMKTREITRKKNPVSKTKQSIEASQEGFIHTNNVSLVMRTNRSRNKEGLVLARCVIKTKYTASCELLVVTVFYTYRFSPRTFYYLFTWG